MNLRPQRIIGHSVEGRPIELRCDPAGPDSTLIIGGIHGNEPATIDLVREFLPPVGNPVALLPLANPDSYVHRSRYNVHNVDINRNAGFNWRADSVEPSGKAPWSEPETRALQEFILDWRPAKIIALHWALGELDADGVQSTALAEAMWNAMSESERRPYRLRVTELGRGQRRLQQTYAECPGSFGQWAGYGLIIQTIRSRRWSRWSFPMMRLSRERRRCRKITSRSFRPTGSATPPTISRPCGSPSSRC